MENTEDNNLDDDIAEALDLIEKQETELAEKKNSVPSDIKEKDQIDINDISKIAVKSFEDVSKKSNEIYDLFYMPLLTREDRTDASKQALIESQRLKNESIQNLVALANAQAKLAQAQAKLQSGNVGIVINSQKGEDIGINLNDLKDD